MTDNDSNKSENPKDFNSQRRNSAQDSRSLRVQGIPRMRNRHQSVEEGTKLRVPSKVPTVSLRPWANATLCLEFVGTTSYPISSLSSDLIKQLDPRGEGFYSHVLWGTAEYGNKWKNVSGTNYEAKTVKISKPNIVLRIRNIKAWSIDRTPMRLRIFRIRTDPLDEDLIIFDEKVPNGTGDEYALGYAMPLICRKTALYSNSTTRIPQTLFEIEGEENAKFSIQINLEWKFYTNPSGTDSDSDIELHKLSDYSVSGDEDKSPTRSIYSDPAVLSAKKSSDSISGIPEIQKDEQEPLVPRRVMENLILTEEDRALMGQRELEKLMQHAFSQFKNSGTPENVDTKESVKVELSKEPQPGTSKSSEPPISLVPQGHFLESVIQVTPMELPPKIPKVMGRGKKEDENTKISGTPKSYLLQKAYQGRGGKTPRY